MKATVFDAIAALALASAVSACASPAEAISTAPAYARFAEIKPGLTKAEVVRIAGRPEDVKTGLLSPGELWFYVGRNERNEEAEYAVTFDSAGVVTGKSTLGKL